jgi:hypothetical protein
MVSSAEHGRCVHVLALHHVTLQLPSTDNTSVHLMIVNQSSMILLFALSFDIGHDNGVVRAFATAVSCNSRTRVTCGTCFYVLPDNTKAFTTITSSSRAGTQRP